MIKNSNLDSKNRVYVIYPIAEIQNDMHITRKKAMECLAELERKGLVLLLSNEGCNRCSHCTYPSAACRNPEMLFPSLEGFGINVFMLAKTADLKYMNGENTVTYFGMLLY